MDKFSSLFKPLTRFMALLLAAFVAGCGGGGDGAPFQFGVPVADPAGGVCTAGAACVPLATAGSFVILTQAAITDAATTSPILGNVGATPITGAAIDLTCAEVTGTIYDVDGAYAGGVGGTDVTCRLTNPALLGTALTDSQNAFADANDNVAHPQTGLNDPTAGVIDATLTPGTYHWTTAVDIPANVTLTGSATDVWIFRIDGNLTQAAGTTVTLAGGALARNIFWAVGGTTAIAAGANFKGIVLSPNVIALDAGASVIGRLFSGGGAGSVTLITNTITRPD